MKPVKKKSWSFFGQVGGMGDVVTALARAVQDEGHQVTCIVPKYDCMNYKEVRACMPPLNPKPYTLCPA